jgi:uncharacterized PurR-regulated membrane protein YhhQ (DUF165 family)
MRKTLGVAAAVAFIGTIVLANYLTEHYGFVAVGFGLMATAGTYAAGLALGLRDAVQETLGRVAVVAAIVAGAAVSWWVAPAFAIASGTAFLVSELCDFTVYTPLRNRNLYGAVIASNAVGAIVDTVIFLWLAFGWASVAGAWQGQFVGKMWITLATVLVLFAARSAWHRRVAA